MFVRSIAMPWTSCTRRADDAGKYGLLNVLEDLMTDANTVKYLLGSVNDEVEVEKEEDKEKDED
jgi:hypothetical protein